MQREKRTVSGKLLEVDYYPVFDDGRRMPVRAAKEKPSTEEQQRYNRTIAAKKLIRLVNANFDETDYFMHPTYKPELAPQSIEEARRDIVNYFRRVKTRRAADLKRVEQQLKDLGEPKSHRMIELADELKRKADKLRQPLKYIYVIEKRTYQRGKFAGRDNWHFHVFLTGGIDRGTLEQMWTKGIWANCNNYQPETFSPEAAGRYMSKDPQGSKRFCYSRNLSKPEKKIRDGKVSKRTVAKMANERKDDKEYWEKKFKGYRFIRTYCRYNAYNGHWYVSVVMYRTSNAPPEWRSGEWITTDY
ncbi:MAG: hypothetical protein LUG23_00250 [Oscillospiraceae bacterium]|nr:hypothetical protein [Oscillospiraceae bacterium]